MADFVAVLKKTIEGLNDNTPELRQRVYAKARETVANKLAAISPTPPQIVLDRQKKALEDAISAVESSFASKTSGSDDFDEILADLDRKPLPKIAQFDHAPVSAESSGEFAGDDAPAEPEFDSAPPPVAGVSAPRAGRLSTPPELSTGPENDPLKPVEAARRPLPPLARGTVRAAASAAPEEVHGPRRRSGGMAVAAVVALAVFAAGGYGIWLNRDAFSELLGLGGSVVQEQPAAEPPVTQTAAAQPETPPVAAQPPAVVPAPAPAATPAPVATPAPAAPMPAAPAAPNTEVAALEPPATQVASAPTAPEIQKFTQRLNADGTEIDVGRADGARTVGEGTSMAQASGVTPPAAPAAAAPTAADAQPQQVIPVGQKAFFYEERTSLNEGTADNGATVWTLVQESPGGDRPPEPAIRGEVTIPSRDLQIRMTIRRNADASLPASHIVEVIFITSGTFEGGGIDNILRIAMKSSEADAGNPLIGIPAKIADGYFLVALSNNQAEAGANTQLLAQQSWIDIPIVYRSGRRALLTMEKGVPGDKVFRDVVRTWQAGSSG